MPPKNKSLKDSKLIIFLAKLNAKDWKQFQRYMDSPFFYKDKKALKLFERIAPLYPDFPDDELDEQQVFEHIYPQQIFNPQKLRNVCSYLLSSVKDCIAFIEFNQFPDEKNRFMRDGLWIRELDNDLEKLIRHSRKDLAAPTRQDIQSRLHAHSLEMFVFHFNRTQRLHPTDVNLIIDAQDGYFLSERFRVLCLVMQEVLRTKRTDFDIDRVKREVTHYQNFTFPSNVAAIFYHLLASMWWMYDKDPQEIALANKHFLEASQLREVLLKVISKETSSNTHHPLYAELAQIFDLTISVCSLKYREGDFAYHHQMFELYRQWMEWNLLEENGKLRHQYYKNVITLALREMDLAYAQSILEEYKERLFPPINEKDVQPNEAYAYNAAHLAMYKHDFEEMKKMLEGLKFRNHNYKMALYILKLEGILEELFYTQNDVLDRFETNYNNYARYVREQLKDSKPGVEQKMFLKIIRRLFETCYDNKRLDSKILEEIRLSQIKEKKWLYEKAKKLI